MWVGSSELIQIIFDDRNFARPFFLTYFSTSLFCIYLLGFLFLSSWRNGNKAPSTDGSSTIEESRAMLLDSAATEEDALPPATKHESPQGFKTGWQTAMLAVQFVPLWFAANWTFNASLCTKCGTGTTVASSTVISSSSSFFTLIMSALVLKEHLSWIKFLSVLMSCGGVVLVTEFDEGSSAESSLLGDGLSLISAILMAAFTVQLKYVVPNEDEVRMPMLLGFLGLFTLIIGLPFLLLFHYTGLEKFEGIPLNVLAYLTFNGVVGTVLSDLLWAQAIVFTSPLQANLGVSLTIPLSFFADEIAQRHVGHKMKWEYFCGAALVFVSFVGVNSYAEDRKDPSSPDVDMESNIGLEDVSGGDDPGAE